MDEEITRTVEEILQFEQEQHSINFLKNAGNVYLAADNTLKEDLLLQKYIEYLKSNLDYIEAAKISKQLSKYHNILLKMAKLMQKKINDLKDLLEQEEDTLTSYAKLRQISQKLLTELFSYIIDAYSISNIPVSSLQKNLENNISFFRFNAPGTSIEVNMDGLKVNGNPDYYKLKQYEDHTHTIAIQISLTTELLKKNDSISAKLPEIWSSNVKLNGANTKNISEYVKADFNSELMNLSAIDITNKAIEEVYEEIYSFTYNQIFNIKLPLESAIINTQAKYNNIPLAIINVIDRKFNEQKNLYSDEEQTQLAELLRQINTTIKDLDFYEFVITPYRIYVIDVRESNSFEKKYYKSFASIDSYVLPELTGKQVLTATFSLGWSMRVYQLSALIICGEEYNNSWSEEVVYTNDFNQYEKILNNIDKTVYRREEIQAVKSQIFNLKNI